MWSSQHDREQAERRHERERQAREREARTATMTLDERIERWLDEPGGEETEDVVELLVEAKNALVRRARRPR